VLLLYRIAYRKSGRELQTHRVVQQTQRGSWVQAIDGLSYRPDTYSVFAWQLSVRLPDPIRSKMPLRTDAPIGERNLRYNPRSRAEWDRLRQTGVIVSVFASNCRGLSTASLEDAIFRVTGKPGRV